MVLEMEKKGNLEIIEQLEENMKRAKQAKKQMLELSEEIKKTEKGIDCLFYPFKAFLDFFLSLFCQKIKKKFRINRPFRKLKEIKFKS